MQMLLLCLAIAEKSSDIFITYVFLKNYLKLQGVKEARGTMGAQSVTLSSGNSNTVIRRKSIKPLIALHLCSTETVVPL